MVRCDVNSDALLCQYDRFSEKKPRYASGELQRKYSSGKTAQDTNIPPSLHHKSSVPDKCNTECELNSNRPVNTALATVYEGRARCDTVPLMAPCDI